jgi:hypothetical protein
MRIPCTHQAPHSCSQCDGTEAETRRLSRANRDELGRSAVRWWLCTTARLPEGYRPRPVDFPAPREGQV